MPKYFPERVQPNCNRFVSSPPLTKCRQHGQIANRIQVVNQKRLPFKMGRFIMLLPESAFFWENVSVPLLLTQMELLAESALVHSCLVFRAVCCNNIAEHIF